LKGLNKRLSIACRLYVCRHGQVLYW
jgi:hypothetical protein